MRRLTITLTEEEKRALLKLALEDRRDPRSQAVYLLRQKLEEVGALQPAVIGAAGVGLALSPSRA